MRPAAWDPSGPTDVPGARDGGATWDGAGRRAAVVVVSCGSLLLGCTESAPSGGAAPSTGQEAAVARPFCDEATAAFGSLAQAFDRAGPQDPAALPPLLDQAVGAFDGVSPPDAVAEDWTSVRGAIAGLRDRVLAVSPSDPSAPQEVEAALVALREDAGPAFERVTAYTQQYCPELAAPRT